MSWLVYGITSIHKLMVRVYGCVNGHQFMPLMPSRLVKMLKKWFGIHYCALCGFGLWFSVASVQLEKGGDLHRFARKVDKLCVKCIASLFSPWHGHASHAIIVLFAGGNEGALGFA